MWKFVVKQQTGKCMVFLHALEKRKVVNQRPWKNKKEEKLNQSEQQKKINVLFSFIMAVSTLAINYLERGTVSLAQGPDALVIGCFALCTWKEHHGGEGMLQKKFLTSL